MFLKKLLKLIFLVFITVRFNFHQVYVSPKLAGVVLIIVPPVALGAVMYGRYVRSITKQVQDSLAEATQVWIIYIVCT